jgi:DNA-binding transcriptional MerR regulator
MSTGNNEKKEFYSIGDVAEITGIKPTVLRFWETEFKELSPIKNKFGHRVYYESDIEIVLKIKNLLYNEGLTIKGAKNILENSNHKEHLDTKFLKKKLNDILDLLNPKE